MNRLSGRVIGAVAFSIALGTATASHAQLASRAAAEWIKTLEAPDRVAGLKIDEVVARLSLKSGDVVADFGAGSGLFALPIAKAVGAGKVYAVELDEGFLDRIREKIREARIGNVVPVADSSRIPPCRRWTSAWASFTTCCTTWRTGPRT